MTTLFTNPLGFKFNRTDYRKRSKVTVLNNNYNLRTYRFNNVPCFESPYISWENLDQCGGWATNDSYLHTAVQNGTKLFAQIVHTDDVKFNLSDDVVIQTKDHWCTGLNETHISRKGCLSDYYNLEDIFKHYNLLGVHFYPHHVERITEFCNLEISVFATPNAPFEYCNASTLEQLVVTGLLLGYPLESTAYIIEEWF